MNIAIWSDTFPPQVNGVASVARDLAAALAAAGHRVAVFSVVDDERETGTAEGSYIVHKIPALSVPKFVYSGGQLAFAVAPSPAALRALKKFKPDIIHSHTPFVAGWHAVIGKKLLRVPIVGTHHTFFDDYLKHVKLDYAWGRNFSWKIMTAYYNRMDAVTSPSRALGAALQEHGLSVPLHVVPNPANTELFTPVDPAAKQELKQRYGLGKQAIVYMGRTSYEKDIDQAIEAFSLAAKELPDATLMIVGDGPERKRLEALAREKSPDGRIIFTGMLRGEALRDALAANDLFLTASRSENMPVSVIEAMAAGLPVAAVRAKGMPEIVSHGENGLLAEPGRPDLLARTIVQLFSSPDDLAVKAAASRKIAERYSRASIARATAELYKKIIAEHRGKRKNAGGSSPKKVK